MYQKSILRVPSVISMKSTVPTSTVTASNGGRDDHSARRPASVRRRRSPWPRSAIACSRAIATASEGLRLLEDTGQARGLGFDGLVLAHIAAIQGEEDRCRDVAGQTIAAATERGLAAAPAWSRHAVALLDLGVGRYDSAFERLSAIQHLPAITFMSLADQIEAVFRGGRTDRLDLTFTRFRPWVEHRPARYFC